ncbi:hypothetical protein, partial [Acidobacterium sp. S8]|uniref:hypothetical protein n=1 Tax=Acidobacterium sp. S8 TaxID=1641854 RepID=UPI001C2078AE
GYGTLVGFEIEVGETSKTGERWPFLWHMLSVGGLPAITALSALFPNVGNFLFSWIQPLLATLH